MPAKQARTGDPGTGRLDGPKFAIPRKLTSTMARRVSNRNSFRGQALALSSIALLACFPLCGRIGGNPRLALSVWGSAAALLALFLVVRHRIAKEGRSIGYEFVPRSAHYVQLVMHACIYGYWGLYWREVYRAIPLIGAQIVFAYALDMLVCWLRRDKWILGFGPFPIILSTNLFLWFRDDWFFLQFFLIATGVLGKEFIRWKRDGRLTHVFNPSSLGLFLFSVVLIATKTTGLTWGIEIANTMHRPPHIYFEIFILGLIVQALFQVTLVTLSAAAALFAMNLIYTRATGGYQFVDSNIPVAVFLGLHLLVTDPATSPRSSLGKILFGAMYGAGVFGMYSVLQRIGAPEFYDKLLCVPPLNLSVRALDRLSDQVAAWVRQVRLPVFWTPKNANLAWMSVWICLFVTMTAGGFLAKGKDHPGGNPEFWQRACVEGRSSACTTWVRTLTVACQGGSSADCFTVGMVLNQGRFVPRNPAMAGVSFGHACDLGMSEACASLIEFVRAGGRQDLLKACEGGDGASCFILGSLFSGGNGVPVDPALAFELFEKSCGLGWWRGCGRLGVSYLVGQGTPPSPDRAIENFEKGCQGENAASCYEAGRFYRTGRGGPGNQLLVRERFRQACELGLPIACTQDGGTSAFRSRTNP